MAVAVRCPQCSGSARVEVAAPGEVVECPRCGAEFEPVSAVRRGWRDSVPVVYPVSHAGDPDAFSPSEEAAPPRHAPGAFGLALLPLGIPLIWLIVPLVGGPAAVFTFATPVAVALGLVGLGLGIGSASGWSAGARMRAVLVVVLVGYMAAGVLYFMKREWAVAARRNLPAGPPLPWTDHAAPERAYTVKLPAVPADLEASPLAGWELTGVRAIPEAESRGQFWQVLYEVAHGTVPEQARNKALADAEWFALAGAALAETAGGVIEAEVPFTQQEKYPGRQYTVVLPDGARQRIVRLIRDRSRNRAFYLAVEGVFLPPDARDVKQFFSFFQVRER